MPKTKIITGEIDGQAVSVTVQAATVLSGMRRAILADRVASELAELNVADNLGDVATLLVGRFTYPDLVGAVAAAEGLDVEGMTLADFLELPQAFADAWLVAVYELCPHWSPSQATMDTTEKKDAEKISGKSASNS